MSQKTGKVNATIVAEPFQKEIQAHAKDILDRDGVLPKLVGFLANEDSAAKMYARWTERSCTKDGIAFELREFPRVELEQKVIEANDDPTVHGIIIYYPVFGGPVDDYLRDVISAEKDVEGLNHQYRYALYHNVRTLPGSNKKCILPCTPLAIVKIMESIGAYDRSLPVGKQLSNQAVAVVNRSEVVGRPLAAMLANDGATVYSIDITGVLVYTAGMVKGTIRVAETEVDTQQAIALADICIAGVPSDKYKISLDSLKPEAIAINFSQFKNFEEEGLADKCKYVPAIGKVTIQMLERNLLRLYDNFHSKTAAKPEDEHLDAFLKCLLEAGADENLCNKVTKLYSSQFPQPPTVASTPPEPAPVPSKRDSRRLSASGLSSTPITRL